MDKSLYDFERFEPRLPATADAAETPGMRTEAAAQSLTINLVPELEGAARMRLLFNEDTMRTRSLKVIDMAVHEVATISADCTITECALRMRLDHVGSLVVTDATARPIGMITDRDIAIEVVARGKNPDESKVSDIMTEARRDGDPPTKAW